MALSREDAEKFLDGESSGVSRTAAENFLDDPNIEPEITEAKTNAESKAQKAAKKTGSNPLVDYSSAFNGVIADIAGFPGDVVQWIKNDTALGQNIDRFVKNTEGLSAVDEGMRKAIPVTFGGADYRGLFGTYQKDDQPDTASSKAGEYVALGLTFLAPILAIGRGAQTTMRAGETALSATAGVQAGVGVGKGIAQKISAPFYRAPTEIALSKAPVLSKISALSTVKIKSQTALAGELIASTGAGYGAYYGGESYGPTGEMVGGLFGGFFASISTMVAPRALDYIKKSIFAYTEPGGIAKGGVSARGFAESPAEEVVKTIREQKVISGAKIPPAQLSEDKHLIAMQKKILAKHPELEHEFREAQAKVNMLARAEAETLSDGTPPAETQVFLEFKIEKAKVIIQKSIDKAVQDSADSIEKMAPQQARNVANETARSKINSSLEAARKVEDEAWRNVGDNISIANPEAPAVFKAEIENWTKYKDFKMIPDYIYSSLGRFTKKGFKPGALSKGATVREMQDLRSRVLEDMREAKSIDKWNKARILDDIQESLLLDMEKAEGSNVKVAIGISRTLKDKFQGGEVGKILGYSKEGEKVASELTLEGLNFGAGGAKTAVKIKQLLNAAPESKSAIEDFLKLKMVNSSFINKEGRVNLSNARKFLYNNDETLKLFPDLKKDIDNSLAIEERIAGTIEGMKMRQKGLDSTIAAKIAYTKKGRFIDEINAARNPEIEALAIAKTLNKEGRAGIKTDFLNKLMADSKTAGFDEAGEPMLSGLKWNQWVKGNEKVLNKFFSPPEMNRMKVIGKTLRLNEPVGGLPKIEGEVIKPGNKILEIMVRFYAAKKGGEIGSGPGSLRTANMASTESKKLLDKLDVGAANAAMKDAIQDKELFITLMLDGTKKPNADRFVKVFQGWMAVNALSPLMEKNK